MIRYATISKSHQKELDKYIQQLDLTTDGEKFVLLHILERDWGRDILLQEIEIIRFNAKGCSGGVKVVCRTRNGSWSFSVAHLGGTGWHQDYIDNIEAQKRYIGADLFHKMD
jgi:hypothetical protein